MYAFVFILSLLASNPALAQDAPEPEAVEEVVQSDEEKIEAEEEAAENSDPEAEEAEEAPEAEEVVEVDTESVSEVASLLVKAVQDKNWALVLGLVLSLLVSLANKFGLKDKVGSKALPWVTTGVAVAGAVGAALISGVALTEALSQGLVAGVAAIGGWEMVLKHIFAKKEASAEASA